MVEAKTYPNLYIQSNFVYTKFTYSCLHSNFPTYKKGRRFLLPCMFGLCLSLSSQRKWTAFLWDPLFIDFFSHNGVKIFLKQHSFLSYALPFSRDISLNFYPCLLITNNAWKLRCKEIRMFLQKVFHPIIMVLRKNIPFYFLLKLHQQMSTITYFLCLH